jgi:energy-converting hydrogenase Eha subunit A
MTGYSHDSPVHRPVDHSWMLAAWVLPLVVAFGITVVTAGFGAVTILAAIMVGLVSTALHRWGPSE